MTLLDLLAMTTLMHTAAAHEAIVRAPRAACASFLTVEDARLRMNAVLERARARLGDVDAAAAASPVLLRKSHGLIAEAARAATTKHQQEFDEEKDWRKLDTGRHLAILQAIAEFDSTRPQWSLFALKRVIEGRHSLIDYAGCKED